jgi:protein-disulfide isomerase
MYKKTIIRLLALAICLTPLACKKSSPDVSPENTESANVKGDANSCKELSDKLCAEAGEKTATCTNAQTTLDLLSDAACAVGIKDFAVTQEKLKNRGKKCDELVTKLCEGLGQETDTCKMVQEKTKQFPPEQCVAMLGNFDDVLKELKAQEAKNKPLTAEVQAQIAAADAPSFGPADAKVTIVEFSDFECPYCSRAANVTTQIKEKYGDKVRFVFRQFPLSFHKSAQGAAEASLAAHSQGKFWEFHDKMFANQRALDRGSLEGYAKDVGLDVGKFKTELDSKQHESRVQADLKMGGEVAVQGTPTMFINGKRVPNPTDFGAVSKAIDAALGS